MLTKVHMIKLRKRLLTQQEEMELKLSCYCCGGTYFSNKEMLGYKIENNIYVPLSDKEVRENAVVVCEKCGLEDYVVNLVPKVC